MGLETNIPGAAADLGRVRDALRAGGGLLAMIDGQLCMPDGPVPATWSDARFRFPAGMITLQRRPGGLAILVFGNATSDLQETVRRAGELLAGIR
jgi:hypothetical protein